MLEGCTHPPPRLLLGTRIAALDLLTDHMLAKWALVHESAWPHLTSVSGAVGYKGVLL